MECTNFKSTVIRVHPPHGSVRAPVEGILLLPSREENAEKLYLGRISINDTDRNNHYIGTSRKPKNP